LAAVSSPLAFTLVELLVVLATIAILAALLLPSLFAAKMQAVRVRCLSNQKQLIVAWILYAGDNDDQLALNGGDPTPVSAQPHLWIYGGNHGASESGRPSPAAGDSLTNALYLTGPNYALFAKYLPADTIYKCPADDANWPLWNTSTAAAPELRSYAMNSYMGLSLASTANIAPLSILAAAQTYAKTAQISAASPANRFVFTDVNPASLCTPAFGVDVNANIWIHYPSGLHRQRGVLVFADGHTETHHWLDPRTLVRLTNGTFLPHNVPSPNNRDLAWLAARTTSFK
jgi:type II secretory pathway pseudopilin PulG